MTILYLDLETYSEVPIKNGVHAYAEGAEILLFAYAIDDGPVHVWDVTTRIGMPLDLAEALRDATEVWAHNSHFDRTILRHVLPEQCPRIDRWRDTMVKALTVSLPPSLEMLGRVMGLPSDMAKMKEGKALVRLFCMPQPAGRKIARATRETHPHEWDVFVEYAGQDIVAMRELNKRVPGWNYRGAELALWHLDQRINDRGVLIDVELAEAAVRTAAIEQRRLAERVADITDGEIASASQRDALLTMLREVYDIELGDLSKATLETRLKDPELPAIARELIVLRLSTATTSVAKYKTLIGAVSGDRRLRGMLQFCGAARTGRWAGRTFQPQNLPRPTLKQAEIEFGIEAVKADAADMLVPDVMRLLSSAVRGVIIAPHGRKLVVADLSNIEGRVLAWLAGEDWKLDAFRAFDAGTGPDLYVAAYAKSFNVSIEAVLDNKKNGDGMMRQIGKVQELALGYQGAAGAFTSMAAIYGVTLPEAQVKDVVRAWRQAHPAVSSFWYDLEGAVVQAINTPKATISCRRLSLQFSGSWLRIRLPSGRLLCYPGMQFDADGKLSYYGIDQFTRRWQRISTYGGKLVENVTQAVARDVMANGMHLAEAADYDVLLTVHDELITETDDTEGFNPGGLSALLATNPSWADDLPLAAAGFETYRYKKD